MFPFPQLVLGCNFAKMRLNSANERIIIFLLHIHKTRFQLPVFYFEVGGNNVGTKRPIDNYGWGTRRLKRAQSAPKECIWQYYHVSESKFFDFLVDSSRWRSVWNSLFSDNKSENGKNGTY